MDFRLTYQGLLLADNNKGELKAARATHKHSIRKAIHPQLKRLWEIHPWLKKGVDERAAPGRQGTVEIGQPTYENTVPQLAKRFSRFGYKFVPLVTREMELLVSIDVLFLRSDPPGSVFSAGDIDNRLKTLFDGLLLPREASQVGEHQTPDVEEDPFFCLLEDDSLITRVSVETDTLLSPTSTPPDPSDARVIITERIKPYTINPATFGFG